MHSKIAGLMLSAIVLPACSSGSISSVKLDDALNSYGGAIRFKEFEKAAEFQNPALKTRIDKAWLKQVHVSSYDLVFRKKHDGSNTVEQTVEIRYFFEDEGVEKSITDYQVWKYYKEPDQWMLETGLPSFK